MPAPATSTVEENITYPGGRTASSESVLDPWRKRLKQAKDDRRRYEPTWMQSQHFAAGKQWVEYAVREHRMLLPRLPKGRSRHTVDVLTQYIWTVIGKLSAEDFRPQMLFRHDDVEGETYSEQLNKALDYGWDEEWQGDETLHRLLIKLCVFGTGAVRCRYDKTRGNPLGLVPHDDKGNPLLDPTEARKFVADRSYYGEPTNLKQIREGEICWEPLSPFNLFPPPGVEEPSEFPWEIVCRPVSLDQLRLQYGDRVKDLDSDEIEATDVLGMSEAPTVVGSDDRSPTSGGKLKEHALVYTGYLKPSPEFPQGQTVTWAGDKLLDAAEKLPYNDRSGISYFRYWLVPERFWGRGLIEPGIGPQRIRNKRESQIDEHIDRGQPFVIVQEGTMKTRKQGNPMEVVEIKAEANPPQVNSGIPVGNWMFESIQAADENIEKALGMRSVALGNAPGGVSAYSAMALLSENDATKLDPIAKRFKLSVADLMRDTIELMRSWGPQKQIKIVGDEDTLDAFTFDATRVPTEFMVKVAKGGSLPRSQAAEIQKIADLWNAGITAGIIAGPQAMDWYQWYKESLDAGEALPFPENMQSEQQRVAQLENLSLIRGQQVPVAPYDDPQIHILTHREQQMELGHVPGMEQVVQAFEQHIQEHLQLQQANAQQAALQAQQGLSQQLAPPPALPQGQQQPPALPPR